MADSPVHKPAGLTQNAPSVEDLDRLAALIKPSWELEDAPFSLGNRTLSADEWAQLRADPAGDATSSRNGSSKLPTAPQVAPADSNGVSAAAAPAATNQAADDAVTAPIPPVSPAASARTSTRPMAFPQTTSAPSASSATAKALPDPASPSVRVSERPPTREDVAGASAAASASWQRASLVDELAPIEKSRKGLYLGLAAAAVVILAGVFFATRSSDTDTPSAAPGAPGAPATPTGSTETTDKGASVSNARVDIPAPGTEQAAPKDSDPSKATKPDPRSGDPAATAPARDHTAPRGGAGAGAGLPPLPHTPPAHNNNAPPAPAAPKASSKANGSGGIVRDVPF